MVRLEFTQLPGAARKCGFAIVMHIFGSRKFKLNYNQFTKQTSKLLQPQRSADLVGNTEIYALLIYALVLPCR